MEISSPPPKKNAAQILQNIEVFLSKSVYQEWQQFFPEVSRLLGA